MGLTATARTTDRRDSLIFMGDPDWRQGGRLTVHNPWDDSVVATLPSASRADLQAALDWGAERAPTVAGWSLADRIDAMRRWADALETHAQKIAQTETREMGKTIRQSRPGIDAQARRVRALCDEAVAGQAGTDGPEDAAHGRLRIRSLREPLGLVVGILPFNSPVAALVWKVAPAILMGNAIVVKLSSQAPVAALWAAHLLHQTGLPEGALQVVSGSGAELSQVLAGHPQVRKISFTGGTEAGRQLWHSAAGTMPSLTLECGSNDAALVLADADIELAAGTVVEYGVAFYNGQLCTAPKRCLVSAEIHDDFVDAVRERAAAVVMGDPLLQATELGPLVSERAARSVEEAVRAGVAGGARLVAGGERLQGALFPPTVVAEVDPDNPLFREGPFGPVLSVTRFTDDREGALLANTSPYGLRAAIFSGDPERAIALAHQLDVGGVAINGPATVGDPHISVDPRKLSGVGSEGIETSLREFSQPKFIWTSGP